MRACFMLAGARIRHLSVHPLHQSERERVRKRERGGERRRMRERDRERRRMREREKDGGRERKRKTE